MRWEWGYCSKLKKGIGSREDKLASQNGEIPFVQFIKYPKPNPLFCLYIILFNFIIGGTSYSESDALLNVGAELDAIFFPFQCSINLEICIFFLKSCVL